MSTTQRRTGAERTDIECRAIGETAEGYVEALMAQGVDVLFLNPGTDTFPVQEALSKYAA